MRYPRIRVGVLPKPYVCVKCGEKLPSPHEIFGDHLGNTWAYVVCPKCGERNVFRLKVLR